MAETPRRNLLATLPANPLRLVMALLDPVRHATSEWCAGLVHRFPDSVVEEEVGPTPNARGSVRALVDRGADPADPVFGRAAAQTLRLYPGAPPDDAGSGLEHLRVVVCPDGDDGEAPGDLTAANATVARSSTTTLHTLVVAGWVDGQRCTLSVG